MDISTNEMKYENFLELSYARDIRRAMTKYNTKLICFPFF